MSDVARPVGVEPGAQRPAGQPATRPMWHVTLTVVGDAVEAAEVRAALERLAHEQPFLLSARYAADRAELRYWEEARDLEDAAALALRLWGEHRLTAELPPWRVVRPRGGRPAHLPAPRDRQPGPGARARRRRPAVLTARSRGQPLRRGAGSWKTAPSPTASPTRSAPDMTAAAVRLLAVEGEPSGRDLPLEPWAIGLIAFVLLTALHCW